MEAQQTRTGRGDAAADTHTRDEQQQPGQAVVGGECAASNDTTTHADQAAPDHGAGVIERQVIPLEEAGILSFHIAAASGHSGVEQQHALGQAGGRGQGRGRGRGRGRGGLGARTTESEREGPGPGRKRGRPRGTTHNTRGRERGARSTSAGRGHGGRTGEGQEDESADDPQQRSILDSADVDGGSAGGKVYAGHDGGQLGGKLAGAPAVAANAAANMSRYPIGYGNLHGLPPAPPPLSQVYLTQCSAPVQPGVALAVGSASVSAPFTRMGITANFQSPGTTHLGWNPLATFGSGVPASLPLSTSSGHANMSGAAHPSQIALNLSSSTANGAVFVQPAASTSVSTHVTTTGTGGAGPGILLPPPQGHVLSTTMHATTIVSGAWTKADNLMNRGPKRPHPITDDADEEEESTEEFPEEDDGGTNGTPGGRGVEDPYFLVAVGNGQFESNIPAHVHAEPEGEAPGSASFQHNSAGPQGAEQKLKKPRNPRTPQPIAQDMCLELVKRLFPWFSEAQAARIFKGIKTHTLKNILDRIFPHAFPDWQQHVHTNGGAAVTATTAATDGDAQGSASVPTSTALGTDIMLNPEPSLMPLQPCSHAHGSTAEQPVRSLSAALTEPLAFSMDGVIAPGWQGSSVAPVALHQSQRTSEPVSAAVHPSQYDAPQLDPQYFRSYEEVTPSCHSAALAAPASTCPEPPSLPPAGRFVGSTNVDLSADAGYNWLLAQYQNSAPVSPVRGGVQQFAHLEQSMPEILPPVTSDVSSSARASRLVQRSLPPANPTTLHGIAPNVPNTVGVPASSVVQSQVAPTVDYSLQQPLRLIVNDVDRLCRDEIETLIGVLDPTLTLTASATTDNARRAKRNRLLANILILEVEIVHSLVRRHLQHRQAPEQLMPMTNAAAAAAAAATTTTAIIPSLSLRMGTNRPGSAGGTIATAVGAGVEREWGAEEEGAEPGEAHATLSGVAGSEGVVETVREVIQRLCREPWVARKQVLSTVAEAVLARVGTSWHPSSTLF